MVDKTASVRQKGKQITSTNGRVDCLRQFQTPRRPSYFPVGVKLMGIVPDYTQGNALYFHFQLRKLVPPISSLGNHIVFSVISAYYKIRDSVHSIAFVLNCV